jgi:hypothetical protein
MKSIGHTHFGPLPPSWLSGVGCPSACRALNLLIRSFIRIVHTRPQTSAASGGQGIRVRGRPPTSTDVRRLGCQFGCHPCAAAKGRWSPRPYEVGSSRSAVLWARRIQAIGWPTRPVQVSVIGSTIQELHAAAVREGMRCPTLPRAGSPLHFL